eukprot:362298-Chlamydomonas_euryale.AAC.3
MQESVGPSTYSYLRPFIVDRMLAATPDRPPPPDAVPRRAADRPALSSRRLSSGGCELRFTKARSNLRKRS